MLDIAAPLPLVPDRSAPRSGETDKTVMGASCTGSYQVTPPDRTRVDDAAPAGRPILARTATASVDGGSHPRNGVAYKVPSHCRRDATRAPAFKISRVHQASRRHHKHRHQSAHVDTIRHDDKRRSRARRLSCSHIRVRDEVLVGLSCVGGTLYRSCHERCCLIVLGSLVKPDEQLGRSWLDH
jgi:hypothetical protein